MLSTLLALAIATGGPLPPTPAYTIIGDPVILQPGPSNPGPFPPGWGSPPPYQPPQYPGRPDVPTPWTGGPIFLPGVIPIDDPVPPPPSPI